jgi:hypothetical protein
MKKAERCKKEINIQYECKLCQELFWDRKLARNHICQKHKIESKLLNMNRRITQKIQGKMAFIRRLSDLV